MNKTEKHDTVYTIMNIGKVTFRWLDEEKSAVLLSGVTGSIILMVEEAVSLSYFIKNNRHASYKIEASLPTVTVTMQDTDVSICVGPERTLQLFKDEAVTLAECIIQEW